MLIYIIIIKALKIQFNYLIIKDNSQMRCKKCIGKLEILRTCGKVQMRCRNCNKEYQIHEVADQINPETEEILESYTAIIYD